MRLALAPMATLSHEALRILINRYGDPDEYFSEMIHAPSFVGGGKYESWYIRSEPASERMVWQLTGSAADSMIRASGMLLSLGGIGLDLNMGCSAPDIARSGAGIAWMSKSRSEVTALVSGVRRVIDSASPSPNRARLGVKLRLGEAEDYARLLDFCRHLADFGVELITLHPRVRKDKYSRPARREYVARLASDLSIPVYGNGDIATAEDALSYAREVPCAGLMIGRAAVRTPWIFSDIRRAEIDCSRKSAASGEGADSCGRGRIDHLEVAEFFLENLARSQPEDFQISRAHRFFYYYCDNFAFAHHIKMKIQNAVSVAEIPALLTAYFTQVPEDRYLER